MIPPLLTITRTKTLTRSIALHSIHDIAGQACRQWAVVCTTCAHAQCLVCSPPLKQLRMCCRMSVAAYRSTPIALAYSSFACAFAGAHTVRRSVLSAYSSCRCLPQQTTKQPSQGQPATGLIPLLPEAGLAINRVL